jgi:hypothetical protein
MATLEELMAEVGLAPSKAQEKTASQKPSSKEVSEVLENLGLSGDIEEIEGAGVTKQAAEEKNMGLTDIYEQVFAGEVATEEEAPAQTEETQEKVASAETEETEPSTVFGELVGYNFAAARESFLDKLAGDLEAEAGAGHDPMAGMEGGGQLTGVIGKAKSPHMPVNVKNEPGKALHTSGSASPYAGPKGKAMPIIQAYLKRVGGKEALIGAQKD